MKSPFFAYVIASYFGGLVMLFTEPSSHIPMGWFAFISSPLWPMVIFGGIFSAPSKFFILQSIGFIVVTFCVYKILRIRTKISQEEQQA